MTQATPIQEPGVALVELKWALIGFYCIYFMLGEPVKNILADFVR